MTDSEGGDDAGSVDIEGKSLAEAVGAVVAVDESRDETLVRDALSRVAEDDVVTGAALDDTMPVVAEEVGTARERATATQFELTKARNAAEPVADIPIVGARLDTYEEEVSVLLERVDELETRHEALRDRVEDYDSLYAVAAEIREVLDEAASVEDTAVVLSTDIEEFADDVEDPEAWINDVQRDVSAVEETVDAIAAVVDALPAAAGEAGDDADADAADADGAGGWANREVDPAEAWFDATLRTELVAVMVEDLRAELDDLREWADRDDDVGEWYVDTTADDLDDLARRQHDLAGRLDDLARPAWTDRFADRLDRFEDELDRLDPPVDWVEMQTILEEFRPESVST